MIIFICLHRTRVTLLICDDCCSRAFRFHCFADSPCIFFEFVMYTWWCKRQKTRLFRVRATQIWKANLKRHYELNKQPTRCSNLVSYEQPATHATRSVWIKIGPWHISALLILPDAATGSRGRVECWIFLSAKFLPARLADWVKAF
jgi:hypothetical protein